jgi:N-methylhydantoinase A
LAQPVLGIDTGGTFTDFVLIADGKLTVHKLPSSPGDPSRAAVEGAAAIGSRAETAIVYGTTVATNALLERKGASTALITTAGFEDVIEIGRQARTRLYDLEYHPPEPLVPSSRRLGVAERVGSSGEVIEALSEQSVEEVVAEIERLGTDAVAISLLFSFLAPAHEVALRQALARRLPGVFVTASSDLLPEFREFERTSTTIVNSYVGPMISNYLESLRGALIGPLRVMQSSGGSITVDLANREPVRTVLSGPAGGVIGATYVAGLAGYDNIITFDMGGTSTDVALCPGRLQTATDFSVADMPIGVPMLDIHTVGAGGGSIARVDDGGAVRVGPESAGADPGPACYGNGEEPTVTDANLMLGRVAPERFLGGRMTINAGHAANAIKLALARVSDDEHRSALGIVRVANSVMERALRTVSLERGHDPRDFTLVPFGGAGPQHACELAEALGMTTVLIPRYPGVLSALGVAIADVSKDYSRTVMLVADEDASRMGSAFLDMERLAIAEMTSEGFDEREIRLQRSLDVRYRGQSFDLRVDWPVEGSFAAIGRSFHEAHEARFGYAHEGQAVEVVNVRLQASVPAELPTMETQTSVSATPRPAATSQVWFDEDAVTSAIYERESLHAGDRFAGPALVTQMDATTVIPPAWAVVVDTFSNLIATFARSDKRGAQA